MCLIRKSFQKIKVRFLVKYIFKTERTKRIWQLNRQYFTTTNCSSPAAIHPYEKFSGSATESINQTLKHFHEIDLSSSLSHRDCESTNVNFILHDQFKVSEKGGFQFKARRTLNNVRTKARVGTTAVSVASFV